jgi:anaerobic magnesium-protoporphyrin IX monomethyl ester cyclase
MKLDSLLISPPIFYKNSGSIWEKVNSNFPPLGLASMAAYLRSKNHTVQIIDCNVESPSVEDFEYYFLKHFVEVYDEIRFVGITTMTPTVKKAYKIAEICKKHYPNVTIAFGGVHPSFLSEEVVSHEIVDFVIKGEGEITFEELVSGKNISVIDGLCYQKNGKYIENAPRERIKDLDNFPMPAYDLLPIEKYRPAKGTYKKLPAMSLMTSRGCPGQCTFCNKTLGKKIVFKDAETIFKEIKYLHKQYGIRQILFYDDTFTVFKDNVRKLCKMLIKSKMNISWTCFARVDFIDKKQLEFMKKAGCHQIMYGVESVNEQVLKNINKKINPKQVLNAVKWTKEVKIDCRVAFMVGNPGDTKEIIEENIRFVRKLEPDLLIVNITTPFPGTVLFDWAKERDLILSYDWDDYNFAKPIMRLENLDEHEIKELYNIMYKSFYLRPKYIMKKILSIRSIEDMKILSEGFFALLDFLKPRK